MADIRSSADLIDRIDEPIVLVEGWNSGEPVRILRALDAMDGDEAVEARVSITWQDVQAHLPAVTMLVSRDMPVRLAGGGK